MQLGLSARKVIFAVLTGIGRRGLRKRVFASVEHLGALGSNNYRTIVDIGANRGQFAMIARYLFPRASIFSFEPLPAAACAWRDVFKNDPRALLQENAISPACAQVEMNVTEHDDSSSLLELGQSQKELFGTKIASRALVSAGPLGGYLESSKIEQPALLKIDVQGFEMEVLKGCSGLLHLFHHIYVECSYIELYKGQALVSDVFELLHSSGFHLRGVFNQAEVAGAGAVQADFLFEAASKCK
jgi:FkbM family methyltransferase